jgi:ubiquinone biosynthesis protein UbiJ
VSGAVSAAGRDLMDEPGSNSSSGSSDTLERLLTVLGPRLDEARAIFGDVTARWHGDAVRVGEETRRRVHDLARELGLVTREEWDELELRVAQLEHRLRLLENAQQP